MMEKSVVHTQKIFTPDYHISPNLMAEPRLCSTEGRGWRCFPND